MFSWAQAIPNLLFGFILGIIDRENKTFKVIAWVVCVGSVLSILAAFGPFWAVVTVAEQALAYAVATRLKGVNRTESATTYVAPAPKLYADAKSEREPNKHSAWIWLGVGTTVGCILAFGIMAALSTSNQPEYPQTLPMQPAAADLVLPIEPTSPEPVASEVEETPIELMPGRMVVWERPQASGDLAVYTAPIPGVVGNHKLYALRCETHQSLLVAESLYPDYIVGTEAELKFEQYIVKDLDDLYPPVSEEGLLLNLFCTAR